MNTYYDQNRQFVNSDCSNKYVSAVYPTETVSVARRVAGQMGGLFRRVSKIIAFLCSLFAEVPARRAIRATVIAVCFFAFLGVIGGVEAGVLPFGVGIVISAFLLFCEVLCLK